MLKTLITVAARREGLTGRLAHFILLRVASVAQVAGRMATMVAAFLGQVGHFLSARASVARAILKQSETIELAASLTATPSSTPAVSAEAAPLAPSKEAVEVDEGFLNNNLKLVDYLAGASRLPEAIKALERHLEVRPRDVAASMRLADMMMRIGEPFRAQAILVAAADASPDNVEINAKAGVLTYEIFRIGQLVDDFSVGIGGGEPTALNRYFRDDFKLGIAGETILRLLGRVSTMTPTPQNTFQIARAQLLLGMFFHAVGDIERAKLAFDITARSGVTFPWCAYMQGLIAEGEGRDNDAERAHQRAVVAHPRFAPAYERLGHLAKKAGNTELAGIYFDAALNGIRIGVDILSSGNDFEQTSVRTQLQLRRLAASLHAETA